MIELVFLGVIVGTLSGFFGIGGGTILIPILLLLGYETKVAISISVIQMMFSSIFGSYLNYQKRNLQIEMVFYIGAGGFVGALLSGLITASVSDKVLEATFLAFAIFALLRLFFKAKEARTKKESRVFLLFLIGFFLGALSMTIGVGGSIILVPILVGFFNVPIKQAVSAGLFFVVFSSVAGFISHAFIGDIDYKSGALIGIASLFGVYIGIGLKDKVDEVLQKRLLISFYVMIVIYLINRIFLEV